MSIPHRLSKSLKKHKHNLALGPQIRSANANPIGNLAVNKIVNNNSWDAIPESLKQHMGPQIQELYAVPWFQTAKDYFERPPQIHVLSIETKEIELLNILGELREYLNGLPEMGDSNRTTSLRKIREILAKINPNHMTRIQRRALRKYIEITPLGRELLTGIFDKVKADGKLAPDMELIFNPYTSLVNLAEIYAQCTEYSLVKYSVPELGIREAQIHLYYPSAKRDEYLADSRWLQDALRRICFFNRLLNTKKQPRGIHVFLAEFRKEFMHVSGKADLVFTPSEINTGVCDMTDIIITRSEESLKTLLHELIHFHALDFKHPAHDDFCAGLFNITTEQSSFNLFEAHTECLASILHCLTRVVFPSQPQTDKEFQHQFRHKFTEQIYYTMRKAAQILATSGCDSYAEFITPRDRAKCQLRENTNVFSYFFVKAFIYLGLQEWLHGCCDPSTARFLDSTATKKGQQGGQDTLKKIIYSGYQNRIFEKVIDNTIANYRNQPSIAAADISLKMVFTQ